MSTLREYRWIVMILLWTSLVMASGITPVFCAQDTVIEASPRLHPKREQYQTELAGYVTQLETINLDPKRYPTYNDYYQDIVAQVQEIIQDIEQIEFLEVLFYECNILRGRNTDQMKVQWLDPYHQCAERILSRLQEIGTEESVMTLVNLLADETLEYDGAYATSMCSCIVASGEMAIPYLRHVKNARKPFAQRIIELIEKGWNSCI